MRTPDRFRVLLLAGVETRYHAYEEVVPPLTACLGSLGVSCACELPAQALSRDRLKASDAIVSITTGGQLTPVQEQALLSAIRTPTNDRNRPVHFLGLHGAACSFSNSPAYYEMLGGRFAGHPPMATFRVSVSEKHPVTERVSGFDIFEELYTLKLCAPVQVLLTGTSKTSLDGAPQLPLGWVKHYGAGKVCYLALGHGARQLEHQSVQRLVENTLAWFGLGNGQRL